MTPASLEKFAEAWRALGALVISRFDFRKAGLWAAAVLPPGLVAAAARQFLGKGYFLEAVTAVETREGFLLTYLYDSADEPGRLAVRALAAPGEALPSLASVYPGAEWHEREAADFFGLEFVGNPNPVPLLLPHDFPGPPPLRRGPGENAASLRDLKIFGEVEIIDPAWRALAEAPERAEA